MIRILVDKKLDEYLDKIKYTFDFIFDSLGMQKSIIQKMTEIQPNDVVICYTQKPTKKQEKLQLLELCNSNNIFFISSLEPLYLPSSINLKKLKKLKKEFYDIFVLSEKAPTIKRDKTDFTSLWEYNFDLVGNIYFHLTQTENKLLSIKGKLADKNFLFFKELSDYPFINGLLTLFEKELKDSLPRECFLVKKALWPEAQNYAVAISATVDSLYKFKNNISQFFRLLAMSFVRPFKAIRQYLFYLFSNYEEYWNFHLFKGENVSYFFGIGTEKSIDYSVMESDVEKKIKELSDEGNDVSIFLNRKLGYILGQKKDDEKSAVGLDLKQIGVRTDRYVTNSFFDKFVYCQVKGFDKTNGFKSGIALPYPNFSSKSQKTTLLLPDTFTSSNLRKSSFRDVSFTLASKSVDRLVENIKKTNGLLCFNFNFSDLYEVPYAKKLLKRLLELLGKDNAYFDTLKGITQWWQTRDSLLVRELYEAVEIISRSSLDSVSFEVFGAYKVKKVTGCRCNIKDKTITLMDIKRYSKVSIHLEKQKQSKSIQEIVI